MRVRPYFPSELQLSEVGGVPSEVQYLRVGKFSHPKYGNFEITAKMLAELKSNFDSKVRRVDPAIDYFHENDKIAAGWPKAMELREDGNALFFSQIEWTPRARQMIVDKELRYFSPDFAMQWTDPESGALFSNVVFGGGLTNRPFVKDMLPITRLGEGLEETNETDKEKSKMDDKAKIAELEKQVADLKAQLEKANGGGKSEMEMSAMKAENEKLGKEVKMLSEKVEAATKAEALAKKETAFNVMLSEGKACAAQKEAFIAGDVEKFASLAQPINLSEKGGQGGGKEDKPGETYHDKVMKLAEDKRNADKSLTVGKAISLVLSENPELAAQYDAE